MRSTAVARTNAPRVGVPSIVRAEFTKFLTLPSVWIVSAVIGLIFTFLHMTAFGDHVQMIANVRPDGMYDTGHRLVELSDEVTGYIYVPPLNAGLLLPVLGAVIAGIEFRAGQLGLSMVAVPNRSRLFAGKVIATTLYVLTLWVVFVAIGFVVIYFAVKDWDPTVLWQSAVFLSCARLLLFMVCATLIGFGITILARSTLVGIIFSIVSIMLVFAQVIAMISPALDAILVPFSAARNLLLQGEDSGPPVTAGALHGGLVLTGWAVVSVGAAAIAMTRRDAR